MRLLIYSDLHLEFPEAPRCFRVPDGLEFDAVLLAGDIHKQTEGIAWAAANEAFKGKRIFYVMGNHEAYHANLPGLIEEMRRSARELGVIFLEDDESIDRDHGVRFLGATLWTDFALYGTEKAQSCMLEASRCMPDFKVIQVGALPAGHQDEGAAQVPRVLKPQDTVEYFKRSTRWLEQKLAEPFDGKTVVVTHHLPSYALVAERYRNDPVSAAFASRIDSLAEQADLWVAGHTHDSFDTHIGKCRVVVNPRGYPVLSKNTIENPAFRDDFVVDV
ncbi:MAG: metallophosphoesterase [Sterolibacterium sp.]